MEVLVELIVWFLLELLGEGLLELALEPLLSLVKDARKRENWSPVPATVGYLALGAALGLLLLWLFPERLLRPSPIRGLSLVLSTIGGGLVMEFWGRYRRASGRTTTNLATWYGGAALALGMAVVRFLGVA